ncbi:uncharacterized protein LOC129597691 [Paramacrobiotus metropolitanus]|uniref:uncharacterized protein LOC129597691 n=1 Tax=Paramacrobiotus metropolitanus TaxID=2943436 RepID=UPI002445F737|nr:uncharacterized protein LOC129597691 [Paramacrobiotus metropolitanus]
MSAQVDLESLGINTEPEWWETVLKYGMIFAAIFQIACIAYAVFGREKDSDTSHHRAYNINGTQRLQKNSKAVQESSNAGSRKRPKQDKSGISHWG